MASRPAEQIPRTTGVPTERFERIRLQEWRVDDPRREIVLGSGAPDWFSLSESANVQRIKEGESRTVWRVRTSQATIYAKVYVIDSWRARLKQRILGSPAVREWRSLSQAVESGVPVVSPVACGAWFGQPRQVALLTEEFEGALRLPDICSRDVQSEQNDSQREAICGIVDAVACLFAVAHERGFVHRDNHPNNILVRHRQGAQYEARFVDVLGASHKNRPANRGESTRALAQLNHATRRLCTRTQRWRFLHSYTKHRTSLGKSGKPELKRLARKVLHAAKKHADVLAKRRDRRLRGDGKYFASLCLQNGWSAKVVLQAERPDRFPTGGFENLSVEQWRAKLQNWLEAEWRTSGLEQEEFGNGFCLERAKPGSWLGKIAWTMRGSPHRIAFRACHRQRHRDIPADFILAYAEHRRFGLMDESLLILANPRK
ncbi:MAG: lipopolysaccharide kinase InaA family protein [Planctomycetota bacterium]